MVHDVFLHGRTLLPSLEIILEDGGRQFGRRLTGRGKQGGQKAGNRRIFQSRQRKCADGQRAVANAKAEKVGEIAKRIGIDKILLVVQ